MVSFVKSLLANNILMALFMFLFAFFFTLIIFEKFRKAIIDSLISCAISILIVLSTKLDWINSMFNLVIRNPLLNSRVYGDYERFVNLDRYFVLSFNMINVNYNLLMLDIDSLIDFMKIDCFSLVNIPRRINLNLKIEQEADNLIKEYNEYSNTVFVIRI